MADSKLSELTAATTAAATDTAYLVQSSVSKQITVANLFGNVSTPVQFTNSIQIGDHNTITAVGADIRWNIDAAASATTMYIKNGDTLYIKTPSTSDAHTLQAMRNASTDGTLEVIVWNEVS